MVGPPVSACRARALASVSAVDTVVLPDTELTVTVPVTSAMDETGGAMAVAVPLTTVVVVPAGTPVTTAVACPSELMTRV